MEAIKKRQLEKAFGFEIDSFEVNHVLDKGKLIEMQLIIYPVVKMTSITIKHIKK